MLLRDLATGVAVADFVVEERALRARSPEVGGYLRRNVRIDIEPTADKRDLQLSAVGVIVKEADHGRRHNGAPSSVATSPDRAFRCYANRSFHAGSASANGNAAAL